MKKQTVLWLAAALLLCACGKTQSSAPTKATAAPKVTAEAAQTTAAPAQQPWSEILDYTQTEQGIFIRGLKADAVCSASVLTLPDELDGVPVVGLRQEAFNGFDDSLSQITCIVLPDSLTEIEQYAFAGNRSLKEIRVSEQNPALCSLDGVLFNKTCDRLISYPGGREETSYAVPEGVEVIGSRAFYCVSQLTEVTFPDTLQTVEESAFEGCSIRVIRLPASVTTLGQGAFYGMNEAAILGNPDCRYEGETFVSEMPIFFADSIPKIQDVPKTEGNAQFLYEENILGWTVTGCSGTVPKNLVIPSQYEGKPVTVIGQLAFCGSEVVSVTIPDTVLYIGYSAFEWCNSLQTVKLSKNVGIVDGSAFHGCPKLTGAAADTAYKDS